jgi:Protein of unknown function (DUF3562)
MQPQMKAVTPASQEVIRELAQQTRRPIDEVKVVYERNLASLDAGAKVKTYVAILARRRTLQALKVGSRAVPVLRRSDSQVL